MLTSQDLETVLGGAVDMAAYNARVARWNRPITGRARFEWDNFWDWIGGKGIITGSGSPGIGG